MKQYFLLTLLFPITLNAQSKLKINSISAGVGIFYINNLLREASPENLQQGGISITAETTVSIDKRLISASYISGSELAILGPGRFHINEFNLMYGRDLEATKWLKFEGFAGLRIVNQEDIIYHKNDCVYSLKVKYYFLLKK